MGGVATAVSVFVNSTNAMAIYLATNIEAAVLPSQHNIVLTAQFAKADNYVKHMHNDQSLN